MTLAFLGGCDPAMRERAEGAATSVTAAAFELCLDTLAHRSRARLLWSTTSAELAPLSDLACALRRALAAHDLPVEARRFSAHVTLARGFGARPARRFHDPVCWPVREFAMVASETRPDGARYRTLARWPLT